MDACVPNVPQINDQYAVVAAGLVYNTCCGRNKLLQWCRLPSGIYIKHIGAIVQNPTA